MLPPVDAHDYPLIRRLPGKDEATPDALLEGFLDYADERGLSLYPAQEEAILEIFSGNNVILATPTGSGKSLVALAACYRSLARREVAFYTAPIKALVSEKFFDMCRAFGPDDVGMMTGDASVNADAPIICCTAEILANLALREGVKADVAQVVMDEFHYYADRERGVAWQIPLLTLPQSSFLLMSATLGDTRFFEEELTKHTKRTTVLVKSDERPVPLDYEYRETPLHETISDLLEKRRAPVYIVHFTQRAAAEQAQSLMSIDFLSKEEKQAIKEELYGFRFDSPQGKELKRFVHHGVGLHHAGLLPKYRLMVEKLAQKGYLKLICGTDTLGVGVNVPIRTVLFTQLYKYDGEKTRVLSVRDFKQIAGRAGRRGFDELGTVVAQAPEHVIENKMMEAKAGGDAKKLRKLVRRKPPDRGYSHYEKSTFERLVAGEPERLVSSFDVSHALLLQMLEREGNGCAAIKQLVRDSHESPHMKRVHGRKAIALFRSLVGAEIVTMLREPDEDGRVVRVHADLQEDFSLNHALSLYVVSAVAELDREAPDYALDVLTIVEATLESPRAILLRQVDKLKGEAVAEMKAAGMEYEERMEELEKIEPPKPRKEFVYETFNAFAAKHPWVGENVRPKSIARDMYEMAATFNEYVKEYGLERVEGVLLRYLSDAYKALVQNVPETAKTDEVYDVSEWLGAVIKQVDSSLLEEWERLKDPEAVRQAVEEGVRRPAEAEREITSDERAFTVLLRNDLFRFVQHVARRRFEDACAMVERDGEGGEWTAERLAEAIAPFFDEHGSPRTDPAARAPKNTRIERAADAWIVEQTLLDPEEHAEWRAKLRVDLEKSRREQRPVLELLALGT
jgi:superfamily II DNA/RNA helicase